MDMSTDDLTIEFKAEITQAAPAHTNRTRAEKLKFIKNQIKTGEFSILDKQNKGFMQSCAKIAKKLNRS
jgi:hypothetical protein